MQRLPMDTSKFVINLSLRKNYPRLKTYTPNFTILEYFKG